MNEIYCGEKDCDWVGDWKDTVSLPHTKYLKKGCPSCFSRDLVQTDGVSEQDYLDQNPRERVSE